MRGWTRLLVVLTAAAVGATPDQYAFQQYTAPGLRQAQRTNSTGNLVFGSVNSLLQRWPNTRYINGLLTTHQTSFWRIDMR